MIKNKKGFTLIELIIVMAIVGILAIVAVVAIGDKAGDARDARRLYDASSIQYAFAMYAIDHGDTYLEGPAGATDILLNAVINKGDINYISLDNVKDPESSRTDTCYSGIGSYRCDREGGYTLFDTLTSDSANMGTFGEYAIGVKLENIETIASIDWPKFAGIETVYAATCPDGVCEIGDGENYDNCPQDCHCGDGMCNLMEGENALNCAVDCAGGEECGDGICDLFAGEDIFSCPDDCSGPEAPEDDDTNDWLYINQNGVNRLPGGNPDGGGLPGGGGGVAS